jgi:hypothetical protein
MGNSVASSPSSPRQVLSRRVRPAGCSEKRLIGQTADVVMPPIGLGKRCVPVASVAFVASPVAFAWHPPKSTLKGVFQNLKRAVWREKSTRLAGLLNRCGASRHPAKSSTASDPRSGTRARV